MAVITYKCKNCGGPVMYSATAQKFTCEYCGSMFEEQELKDFLASLESEGLAPPQEEEEVVPAVQSGQEGEYLMYNCPSCGAEIVTDTTTVATNCYYCHNPIILAGKLDGNQMPDKVIPFSVDKKKALSSFDTWVGGKRYVPASFYSKDEVEKINGVYFPYWLYDTTSHVDVDREGEETYTKREGDYRVTYRRRYRVVRKGDLSITNLPKAALKKSNKKLVENVMPFDFDRAIGFNKSYLSGFLAERKDIEPEELRSSIEEDVFRYSQEVTTQSMDRDRVPVQKGDVTWERGSFHYALLPVWTITYNDKDSNKIFSFSVNGQSGKVVGELPIDKVKLTLFSLLMSLPVMVVLLLVMYLINDHSLSGFSWLIGIGIPVLIFFTHMNMVIRSYTMTEGGHSASVSQVFYNTKEPVRFAVKHNYDLGTTTLRREKIEKK